MKSSLTILKIGGAVLEDEAGLAEALGYFSGLSSPKILVHGGGRRASELSWALGIAPRMHEGRRITDAAALEVAVMVYAGLENKRIVAKLQALGCPAIGLSGADANIIQAEKRKAAEVDYGWVGDVRQVSTQALEGLMSAGLVPVCCAITHDGQGQLLNTNADTIAAELAICLAGSYELSLLYCFEQAGVMMDLQRPDSVLPVLRPDAYARHRQAGIIVAGMVPKLDNAFRALRAGAVRVAIGHLAALSSGQATELVL